MDTDVLVVGGGAAGLAAATALRAHAPHLGVTLVNPTPYNVYRPWLQYVLPHLLPPDDLRIPLAPMAEQHGFVFRQAEVDTLDAGAAVALLDGEPIRYRRVIIAAGAPTDHAALPGAARHAVFPCDLPGFTELQQRLDTLDSGVATIVLTGERISPGLEDAAWLARTRSMLARPGARIRLVADGSCFGDQFGSGPARRIRQRLEAWGAEVVLGTSVASIQPDGLTLADGRTLPSAVTAVVGALRGPDVKTSGLTDERGFFPVDAYLRSAYEPTVFVAGDAVAQAVPGVRKNWQLAVRQAITAAGNVVRSLAGDKLSTFDDARDRRLAGFSLPDVGGKAYLVWNGRLISSGRAARRIRIGFDRKHFAAYLPEDARWKRVPAGP
ncbi:MAG TPA: FAD-dependent oxidoreductase [Micromonosporaceae bacterium]|nr:FAD-dependent oxidoreductase [Micromonosporaceae bacterium]